MYRTAWANERMLAMLCYRLQGTEYAILVEWCSSAFLVSRYRKLDST